MSLFTAWIRADSLQYDLPDIYIPILIDRTIFRLIHKGQFQPEHFEYDSEKVLLEQYGIRIFLEAYQEFLKTCIEINDLSYGYRGIIRRDIFELTSFMTGKSTEFNPYILKW